MCFKERKQQLEKEKTEVEELRSEREGQFIKNIYQFIRNKVSSFLDWGGGGESSYIGAKVIVKTFFDLCSYLVYNINII